jgi:hypothetical protein
MLRAEANRVRRLYQELQEVYGTTDPELTTAVGEMTQELGLDG